MLYILRVPAQALADTSGQPGQVVYVYVHVYVYVCGYVYMCMHVYMYHVCMYSYIYIYTHLYTQGCHAAARRRRHRLGARSADT